MLLGEILSWSLVGVKGLIMFILAVFSFGKQEHSLVN